MWTKCPDTFGHRVQRLNESIDDNGGTSCETKTDVDGGREENCSEKRWRQNEER